MDLHKLRQIDRTKTEEVMRIIADTIRKSMKSFVGQPADPSLMEEISKRAAKQIEEMLVERIANADDVEDLPPVSWGTWKIDREADGGGLLNP